MKDSFYRKLIVMLLIPIFSYAMKYVYNIMLSHLLKGGLYGDFMIGVRTLILFSSFVLLGTATTSKRFLSSYLQQHDDAAGLDYIRWNLRLITKSVIFFIGFLTVLIVLMVLLHVFNYKDFRGYHLAFYMVFLCPMTAFFVLLTVYIECNDHVYLYDVLTRVGQYFIYILVFLIVYYIFAPSFNNIMLWSITFIVFFILIAVALVLAFFYLPSGVFRNILYPKTIFSYPIKASGEWKKTSRRFIISENLFIIVCTVDLYIIKFFAHDTFAVSQYAVISSISGFVWVVSNCIAARLESVIYSCIKNNDKKNLQKYANECSGMNFLISSCATALIIYFSKGILRTFGAHYATHALSTSLIILLICYYIGTFGQLANRLLALSGNEVWLIYVTILELGFIVVLGVILTIEYNVVGLATAATISVTIKTLAYIILAYRKTGIKTLFFI